MTDPKEITEWMKTQGYPLEMRVARLFSANNFITAISEYYIDFEGKKKREIDVIAKLWSEYSFPIMTKISLNIECKKIPKPWIILKAKEKGIFYEPYDLASTKLYKNVIFRFMQEPSLNGAVRQLPIYKNLSHYYGITEFKGEGNKRPFQAMCGSSKSVINEIEQTDEWESSNPKSSLHQIGMVIPVIIIEGQLFEYEYNDSTGGKTNEINIGSLRWKYYKKEFSMVNVIICNEKGIEDLIRIVKETMEALDKLIQENIPIVEALLRQ